MQNPQNEVHFVGFLLHRVLVNSFSCFTYFLTMNNTTTHHTSRRAAQFFFSFILVVYTLSFSACQKSEREAAKRNVTLPIIKAAPAFAGRSAESIVVESKSLQGSVWIAYFFFSSCGGPCPTLNQRISELQSEIGNEKLQFVGFSVDPETDTPKILAQYGKRYNANPKRWKMLQMSEDSLKTVAVQGFMLGSPEEPSLHSTRFALVDKAGQIRGFYDGMDDEALKKLRLGIAELLAE